MTLIVTPSTAAPGTTVSIKGKGAKKRDTRLRISGQLVAEFRTGGSGQFTRTVTVPTPLSDGPTPVVEQQFSTGAWRQVDSGSLTIKNVVVVPPPVEPPPIDPPPVEPPPVEPPPVDPAPTVTAGPTASDITQGGAKITWTVSEKATGWIDHGLTPAYGSTTPAETSFDYSTHIQNLSGYAPGIQVFYRVSGKDQAGQPYSKEASFTTAGTVVEPPPGPEPSPARPFPAPVTSRTVAVPAGATASEVQSIVNSTPDGSVFDFKGDSYTMTNGIYLRGRRHLRFEGNGATIRTTGSGGSTSSSSFKLDNDLQDIAIRNFAGVGSNPDTDWRIFHGGKGQNGASDGSAVLEGQHGFSVWDVTRLEIDNVQISHVYGDWISIGGKNSSPYRPSQDVWIHGGGGDYIGRMGLVPNYVDRLLVEKVKLDHIGLIALDVEPDNSWEGCTNMELRDFEVGAYSLSPHQTNWFFAHAARHGCKHANWTVQRVRVTGTPGVNVHNPAGKGGLATRVDSTDRVAGYFRFLDNVAVAQGGGNTMKPACLNFEHVDGLRVTGNDQPMAAGKTLVYTSDCPGAVTTPNP